MQEISELKEFIHSRQKYWSERLAQLQNVCHHHNVTKKHGSNTGNWCKSDDYYWIDFHCPDCDKRWTVDQ